MKKPKRKKPKVQKQNQERGWAFRAMLEPVEPEDMVRAFQALADLEGAGGIEAASIRLAQEFRGEQKAGRLIFRLEALDSLRDHPSMKPWTMPTGDVKSTFLAQPLLDAAAVEPLIVTDDEKAVTFDPDSFFRRVLELVEAEKGHH